MEVKVKIKKGQSLEQAEDDLFKALRGKKKALEKLGERYADDTINDFHDKIMAEHLEVLEGIKEKVQEELNKLVST